ncbi:glycosyltransferase family 25 protein [Alginatibacterium sediminis]|uniref:Glycosyltransferase family 25 protein n=1 Tax=Alginatibacterium sediminis TaxID=2164068 RepID=A0A420ENC6_9ALTE|nr:glycosyltransferase family 25 protein [Alginatibacterium sediminis]RKF22161.1 glycosyltransferase family 25 protein [Alginatibacterium sediminis]
MNSYTVFVIHVSEGYNERKEHIDRELPKNGISNYEYILDGDIKDLDSPVGKQLFSRSSRTKAEQSCFYKHYLAYKEMERRNIEFALILEDDVILARNFPRNINNILTEIEHKTNYLINVERAELCVPFYYRKFRNYIYPVNYSKLTGGYIIHRKVAEKITKDVELNGATIPIDTFHGDMKNKLNYNLYWTEPCLVDQGSKDGTFASSIDGKLPSKIEIFKSRIKRRYRLLVWCHVNRRVTHLFRNVNEYK